MACDAGYAGVVGKQLAKSEVRSVNTSQAEAAYCETMLRPGISLRDTSNAKEQGVIILRLGNTTLRQPTMGMSDKPKIFDPYHTWLGIPPSQQPPHHYRLLGVELFESDPDVIDIAANRQVTYLRQVGTGNKKPTAKTVAAEIVEARRVLLNANSKRTYDDNLRQQGLGHSADSDDTVSPSDITVRAKTQDNEGFSGIISTGSGSTVRNKSLGKPRSKADKKALPESTDKPAKSKTWKLPAAVALAVAGIGGTAALVSMQPSSPPVTQDQIVATAPANSSIDQAALRQQLDRAMSEAQETASVSKAPIKSPQAGKVAPAPRQRDEYASVERGDGGKGDVLAMKAGGSSGDQLTSATVPAGSRRSDLKPLGENGFNIAVPFKSTKEKQRPLPGLLAGLEVVDDFGQAKLTTYNPNADARKVYSINDGKLWAMKSGNARKQHGLELVLPSHFNAGDSFGVKFSVSNNEATGTFLVFICDSMRLRFERVNVDGKKLLKIAYWTNKYNTIGSLTLLGPNDNRLVKKMYTLRLTSNKQNTRSWTMKIVGPDAKEVSKTFDAPKELGTGQLKIKMWAAGRGSPKTFVDTIYASGSGK